MQVTVQQSYYTGYEEGHREMESALGLIDLVGGDLA